MEFLREVLGEKYGEFSQALSDYNERNPERQIKLANLADGGYVDKDKYAALKAKYEKEKESFLKDTENIKKEYALELALKEEKPRNTKALRALLDFDLITYEDGVLNGFSEQIEKIRKENAFLFEEGNVKPQFSRSVSGANAELSKEDFKKLSYMEKLKLKKDAPKIYNELK